jgi:outer membrane protein assembly factor BamB
MPDYAIAVPEPDFKYTTEAVFYADDQLTIYRDGPFVRAIDKNSNEIETIRCPSNFKHFESIDLGDAVLLMFSGDQVIIIDKAGNDVTAHQLATYKFGVCVTPMLLSKDTFRVIFGTRSRGHVQFVTYDYIARQRIAQTSSWKMANITDFTLDDDKLYALLDNSFMICSDIETGESLWTRFETGQITPRIVPDDGEIFYACQGVLKRRTPESEAIKIPLVKVHTVEAKFGDGVILTGMQGKSLCCYDLSTKKIRWEIRSNLPVQQTLPIRILTDGKIHDALIVRTKNHVTIIDCAKGKTVYHNEFDNLARIRRTGSCLLLHKYNGATGIISGELV